MTFIISVLKFFWHIRSVYSVMPQAWRDVIAERVKQVGKWPFAHDDKEHKHMELIDEALFVLHPSHYDSAVCNRSVGEIISMSMRERCIRAAALLLAEVERIDRANGK